MLNLAEYKSSQKQLSDFLPWGFLVAPDVVLNKDGSFQSTVQFRGPDVQSQTPEELISLSAKANNALKRFGSGWAIFFEARRQKAQNYPESNWPTKLGWLIDEERKSRFQDGGRFFESRYFLTLCWYPPEDQTTRLQNWFIDTKDADREFAWRDHLTQFQTRTAQTLDLLTGAFDELSLLSDEALLTYLHSTCSGKLQKVQVPETPAYLDHLLADEPLTGGFAPQLGSKHLRILTIKGLPPTSEPGFLDALNELGFTYRWVTRFIPLDKLLAQREIEKTRKHWFAKRKSVSALVKETFTNEASALIDTDAENKAVEADIALQDLGSDAVSFGYMTTSLIVSDDDPDQADDKLRRLDQVIQSRGFTCVRENINAVDAWIGSLPGQVYANIRQPLIHTLNLAHFCPLSAVWAGDARNKHLDGPPLMQVSTDGSTPFRLTTHYGDVGHAMIVGPTGAGKSVLLSTMVAQFCRYKNAQVIMFDKGQSARATILGLEGKWSDLGNSNIAAFQPLQDIDNEDEAAWALEWIELCLKTQKLDIEPVDKEELWNALQSLSAAPKEERTLTGLSLLLQNQHLKQALEPYTIKGAYGHVLDSDTDDFCVHKLHGIEMEDMMQQDQLILPVLSLLFRRLEQQFVGDPTLLILDEAWVFLDHPAFSGKLREWLKTLRKKNVSVVFATQSLADIDSSDIAPTLIESCPTRIFLPNAMASEKSVRRFYDRFGLNDRQLQLIAETTSKKHYYFQSPRGNRIFDLDLGEIALAFCAASTPEDQRHISELVEPSNDDRHFAAKWLEHKGLSWACELYGGANLKTTGETA